MKEYYIINVYDVNDEEVGGFDVEKNTSIEDIMEILKNEFKDYYKITIN